MYHAKQDRLNMFGSVVDKEVYLRREIDAQKYMLSVADKYKIPIEEIETIRKNLEYYENIYTERYGAEWADIKLLMNLSLITKKL